MATQEEMFDWIAGTMKLMSNWDQVAESSELPEAIRFRVDQHEIGQAFHKVAEHNWVTPRVEN